MNVDDIARLSVIGHLLRRYWRMLVVLAVLGGLLGGAGWFVLAPGWTAGSKILILGSLKEEQVLAETQIATSLTVLDRTAESLGQGEDGTDLRGRVAAVVVEGSVIAIRATASSPEQAAALTEAVAREYMGFSAELVGQAAGATAQALQRRQADLQQRVDDTRAQITELEGSAVASEQSPDGARARAELDQLGNTLTSTTAELQDVEGRVQEVEAEMTSGAGRFAVLESAVPAGAASPTVVQMAGGGALLLAALGLFALLYARHTDRRLRSPLHIGEALGVPTLADLPLAVEVPATGPRTRRGPRALLTVRRPDDLLDLLREDGASAATEDRPQDVTRFRRVLDHLWTDPSQRHTLLVPSGDAAARCAADLLASVDPDRPHDVVEFGVERPRPETGDGGRRAAVVVGAGTLTAWQLVEVGAACSDAGIDLVGVLVVTPIAAPAPPSAEDPGDDVGAGSGDPEPDVSSDAALAGSA